MKGKDPAFLFYTKEFYEGTRTMLPNERACYVDLMIYQHQHGGFIPDDLERMSMYCSGCSKEIVSTVLQTKFQRCPEGWFNEALKKVITEREEYSDKQSENGRLSQYYSKVKKLFSEKDFRKFETVFKKLSRDVQIQVIENKDFEPNKNTDPTTFITSFQHLSDSDSISDSISIEDSLGKESVKGKPFPEYKDCLAAYFEFYKKRTGAKPSIKSQDCVALKRLILHFRTMAKEGHTIVDGFNYVFNNWNTLDSFTQNRIDLTHIFSNINSIISQIKNPKKNGATNTSNTNYTSKEFQDGIAESISNAYAARQKN
jgi:uncharacterized protein YdaU (DUF1376 family)